ncbi:hypothetical protein HanXRQr2_Chr17g0808651 [Helianthus annuus]|uniref:Uncharacterized protein n=1 Tax=Helianthus annuus TaxID=4232 RepID=A0A251RQY5_HELAN|nr:hypothetical protein HanXRQr2_Chr17g0808651 [Helianthus annuus]
MQLWIHVNKVHGDLRNVRMRRIFLLLFLSILVMLTFVWGGQEGLNVTWIMATAIIECIT